MMGVINVERKLLVLMLATLITQGSAMFFMNPSFWSSSGEVSSANDMISSLKGINDGLSSMHGGLFDIFDDYSTENKDENPFDMQDFWGLFKGGKRGQGVWWKGPHVCMEREEIDENQHKNDTDGDDNIFGNFHFSSCQQTDTKYVCTSKVRSHGIHKTYIVRYQCCHGYKREEGKPGCTEANLKSLMDTLNGLGAHDYIELVRSAGLEEKLSVNNLTVFAPSDDAIRDFTDSVQEANQVEFYAPTTTVRRRRSTSLESTSMKEIVLGHMVEGFHDISEITNEQILFSDNNNSSIRINIYPLLGERVVTANCARVTSVNNYATNGIVHVVDRVIQPVGKTLAELIAQDDQFTTFKTMLGKADMLNQLSGPEQLTLFAPTDSAFDKLDQAVRKRLMQAESCISNVVRHHLVSQVLCSAAIQARTFARNLGGNTLVLERHPEDGKLFINDVQIVVKDIIATNGVIHVIDDVLMPDSGRPVSGVLSSHNLTTFSSLLNEAGLTESLDGMNNVTIFAPTDEALSTPEAMAEIEKVRADKDRLRDLLLYHTTGPEVHGCDLMNNQELKTGLADKSVRINLYATLPFFSGGVDRVTVECARVVNYNNRACGGVVHEIERLLVPPAHSIEETLESMANYTILSRLIKNANLEAELKENAPYTLLAPSDEVFKKLDEKDLKRLLEDNKLAARILKQHILPEMLCCSGVGISSWPFINRVETLGGRSVGVRRDHDDRIHVGSTTVQQCDIMATNGIIHTVNRIMLPQGYNQQNMRLHRITNPNVEVFLYGL
ncbi:transforming growth factor-beta-induced protein ig-h3 [Anabrus simplex]|uniref:transforming growth factor-beta-induced protein ig-h3 n=1 Tax=Anabrus simplex TaxID=316456 RepID=UPI0035A34CCF